VSRLSQPLKKLAITRMYQTKRWNVFEPHAAARELGERLKTSPLVAHILLNRGMDDCDICREFLRPTLKSLLEPATIPNLRPAAERIAKSIRDREKIVVYGDYDVDGITATAILWHAIQHLGGVVEYYIPHRIEEGYGLNAEAVEQICAAGAKLIVTVDCGVTAIGPAKVARYAWRGFNHHRPPRVARNRRPAHRRRAKARPDPADVLRDRSSPAADGRAGIGLCQPAPVRRPAWHLSLRGRGHGDERRQPCERVIPILPP
jgi:hypothetical protein